MASHHQASIAIQTTILWVLALAMRLVLSLPANDSIQNTGRNTLKRPFPFLCFLLVVFCRVGNDQISMFIRALL